MTEEEPTRFIVYADDGAIYGVGSNREEACRDARSALSERVTDALHDALFDLARQHDNLSTLSFDLYVTPADRALVELVKDRGGNVAWHMDARNVAVAGKSPPRA